MSRPLLAEPVELRPVTSQDVPRLVEIRRSPSVHRWWGPPEHDDWPFDDPTTQTRTVWSSGRLVGFVQWYADGGERYRHAGIDLFLVDEAQGHGLGRYVVALVVQHLVSSGHHRIVIDPAASNVAAIACYSACGFREVGVMRRYEKDVDGEGWHDGLLMELVVET